MKTPLKNSVAQSRVSAYPALPDNFNMRFREAEVRKTVFSLLAVGVEPYRIAECLVGVSEAVIATWIQVGGECSRYEDGRVRDRRELDVAQQELAQFAEDVANARKSIILKTAKAEINAVEKGSPNACLRAAAKHTEKPGGGGMYDLSENWEAEDIE